MKTVNVSKTNVRSSCNLSTPILIAQGNKTPEREETINDYLSQHTPRSACATKFSSILEPQETVDSQQQPSHDHVSQLSKRRVSNGEDASINSDDTERSHTDKSSVSNDQDEMVRQCHKVTLKWEFQYVISINFTQDCDESDGDQEPTSPLSHETEEGEKGGENNPKNYTLVSMQNSLIDSDMETEYTANVVCVFIPNLKHPIHDFILYFIPKKDGHGAEIILSSGEEIDTPSSSVQLFHEKEIQYTTEETIVQNVTITRELHKYLKKDEQDSQESENNTKHASSFQVGNASNDQIHEKNPTDGMRKNASVMPGIHVRGYTFVGLMFV